MTTIYQRSRFVGVLLAGLLIAACTNLQEPAQKVIADADAALQAVSADAQKYTPDQYSAVSQQVSDLKASFDKKDYKTVVDQGPKVVAAVQSVGEAAAAKKKEAMDALQTQWTSLSASLPASVASIDAKLAEIKKTHKMPKGVSKEAVASATTSLDDVKKTWADAQSASTSGKVEEAVAKAKAAQGKVAEIMTSLGMSSGDGASK